VCHSVPVVSPDSPSAKTTLNSPGWRVRHWGKARAEVGVVVGEIAAGQGNDAGAGVVNLDPGLDLVAVSRWRGIVGLDLIDPDGLDLARVAVPVLAAPGYNSRPPARRVWAAVIGRDNVALDVMAAVGQPGAERTGEAEVEVVRTGGGVEPEAQRVRLGVVQPGQVLLELRVVVAAPVMRKLTP